MHISQLLNVLLPAVYIEVMVARLPKLRSLIIFKQQLLIGIWSASLGSQFSCDTLLQDLHGS